MAFKERELPKMDWKAASAEEREEAMKLLAKKKDRLDRIKKGELKGAGGVSWAEMSPEQKEKAKKYAHRRNVRQALLLAKATAAGVVVSDKEVDAEIAKRNKK